MSRSQLARRSSRLLNRLTGSRGNKHHGSFRKTLTSRTYGGFQCSTEQVTSAEGDAGGELIGGRSGPGWVAVKAVLLFAGAHIGLRLGDRSTLGQLGAFNFAVAVAIGAIIGRGATASDTSFAFSAIVLVTFLVAHRIVAIRRRHSGGVCLIDHPPRVLAALGELQSAVWSAADRLPASAGVPTARPASRSRMTVNVDDAGSRSRADNGSTASVQAG